MRGGDRGGQRHVTDLERAHPVRDGDGDDVGIRRDFRCDGPQHVLSGRMTLVLQSNDAASVVVVAHYAGEAHHGSRAPIRDRRLVFGDEQGKAGHG
jgi:hypothetical protein